MDDLLSTLQGAGPQPAQSAAPAPASAPQPAAFDPTKTYGTPSKLLDNLTHTESSGNAYAVNKDTGAMGPYQFTPSTLSMLSKQGIKFDPFDPVQARNAADYYLQQLKQQNGGTYEGALKAYGGFVTKDPSQYIGKVMNGVSGQSAAPAPTIPGQSNSGQQPAADSGPMSDLMAMLQAGGQQAQKVAQPAPAQQPPGPGMPTKPMTPVTAAQNNSSLSDLAEKGVGNLASSLIGIAGAGARLVGANDFANESQAARAAIDARMQADTNNSMSGKVAGLVGSALPYATLGGASIPGAMAGGAVAGAIPAIADNGTAAQVAQGAAIGAGLGAGGAVAGRALSSLVPAVGRLAGISKGADASAAGAAPAVASASASASGSGAPAMAVAGGRGSVGSAGTSFAQQAAAEGVPDAIVNRIAAAERTGSLNPTAAERHIEAGSLPVPVELTAGQASGDINQLSHEMNTRGKNPDLAARFNAQNTQIADNLTHIRDQVSPDVNVPSGTPTGQALVDAYKEMDEPVRQEIADQYSQALNADGTSALINATGAMRQFESQIGPTRFNALPSRVQQIFSDAKQNTVTLPAQFDQGAGSARAMNARDIMDIDQTLSGAIAEAKSPTVQHDIGQLRDAILSAPIDPAAGPQAVQAFKTAQASARARFQTMDADPAYKAAVNDIVPQGEPSPLADQFVQKYIAGGKASNVQNMAQNLSTDPVNQQLIASALIDHIRAQAGIDLRTGAGNISQAGLNKALVNLGDKTRIALGPQASQTLDKLGNVARYTQEQPRGSFVNNSNTAVTLMAHAGGLAKSAVERGVNAALPGAQLGSWAREGLATRANAKAVARALEPGAGMKLSNLAGSRPFGDR